MLRKPLFAAAAICLIAGGSFVAAQEKAGGDALERVGEQIRYLASDELEGRGVETEGIRTAANYIRDAFKADGLMSGTDDGTYFQPFNVRVEARLNKKTTQLKLTTGDGDAQSLKLGEEFQPQQIGGSGEASGEIVFVGYGISAPEYEYDDYADIDVKGKVLLMIRREPQQKDADSVFKGTEVTNHSYINTKLALARKLGAAGVLFANDPSTASSPDKDELSPPTGFGRSSGSPIPFAQIKVAAADALLAASPVKTKDGKELTSLAAVEKYIDEGLQTVSQPLTGCKIDYKVSFKAVEVETWNVVGVIEGEGPLADETIVIGAHYDHLGLGGYGSRAATARRGTEIHNGADDNATGTVAVMELARRFARAPKKPARRMVFIAFSGEERGLLGSRHYANVDPLFPLENTVAMLNFDMIGNLRNNMFSISGATTGVGLEEVAKAADEATDVKVDVKANFGGGSDHLAFYMKQVPVLFAHTGLTPLYHTPDDDFETLNIPGTVAVIDYCEELLKGVAAMPERPSFVGGPRRTRPRGPRPVLGVLLREPEEAGVKGLAVELVPADSPGAKAGLKPGDTILTLGGVEMKNRGDLLRSLNGKRPGDKIKAKVVRDGEEMDIEIELGTPDARRRAGAGRNSG